MKRLNIIFISLLAMVCTVLSCSDDSVEDKDIQKIDPVGQLEVYKTSRSRPNCLNGMRILTGRVIGRK